jgi:hypothetical protein
MPAQSDLLSLIHSLQVALKLQKQENAHLREELIHVKRSNDFMKTYESTELHSKAAVDSYWDRSSKQEYPSPSKLEVLRNLGKSSKGKPVRDNDNHSYSEKFQSLLKNSSRPRTASLPPRNDYPGSPRAYAGTPVRATNYADSTGYESPRREARGSSSRCRSPIITSLRSNESANDSDGTDYTIFPKLPISSPVGIRRVMSASPRSARTHHEVSSPRSLYTSPRSAVSVPLVSVRSGSITRVAVDETRLIDRLMERDGFLRFFEKVGPGVYKFGSKRVVITVKNDKLLIRQGSAFVHIADYVHALI